MRLIVYIITFPELQIYWNKEDISNDVSISMSDILSYPEFPWEWYEVENPNISIEDIIEHKKLFEGWETPFTNPNFSLQTVFSHLELSEKWDWYALSIHPNITLEDILAHPDLPWERSQTVQNPNITLQDILAHPDLPWEHYYIFLNPNITDEDRKAHPELFMNPNRRSWHSVDWCDVKTPNDNYIKIHLHNMLNNPNSKLCSTQFEM